MPRNDRAETGRQLPAGELVVGEWLVAPSLHRMWHPERGEVSLEPRVMQVLVRLAREPGRVVSREELVSSVWPGPHVTDDAVSRCASALRRALGDEATAPRYLETIRKGGYRLLAPVRRVNPETPAPVEDEQTGGAGEGTAAGAASGAARTRFADAARSPRQRQLDARSPRPWHRGLPTILGGVAGALLLGALLALRPGGGPPRAGDSAHARLLPATSFPGAELDPALSPSGRLLAFCWNGPAGDNLDLYVGSVGGDRPLRLTEHPAEDRNPAWAPDGERLAFVRERPGGAEILVVPVVGGGESRVTTSRMPDLPDLAWSPEGRWLYFADRVSPAGPTALFRVELATGRRQQVTAPPANVSGDRDLALSHDGRRLAFARALIPGVEDLWTAPAGGGAAARLTRDLASVNGIEWSADDRHLLVSSSRSGQSQLWWIPARGGAARAVRELGDGALDPTLAGARLVFERTAHDSNLWRVDLASGAAAADPRRWLGSTRLDHAPAIAPDGRSVAFVTDRSGPSEVWFAELDTGTSRRLHTSAGPVLGSPAWSPDGAELVVAQLGGRQSELVAVTPSGRSRRLYRATGLLVNPYVARDGRSVYFGGDQGGSWGIWKLPLAGGSPERVTRQGADRAQQSLDGSRLYVGRRDAPGLYRVGREGALDLVPGTSEVAAGADWQIGRAHVYVRPVASGPTGARALLRVPLAGGVAEALTPPLHGLRLSGLGISLAPDERYLLFGRIDDEESDLLLASPVPPPGD